MEEAGDDRSQEGVSQVVQEGGILPWPNKQHREETTVSVGPDAASQKVLARALRTAVALVGSELAGWRDFFCKCS